jgi:HEAT repeat protein
MARPSRVIWLGIALLICTFASPVCADEDRAEPGPSGRTFMPELPHYRNILKESGIRRDADSLSKFLQSRAESPAEDDTQRFKELVSQLNADDFKSRDQADWALRRMAHRFLPELKNLAETSREPEVKKRAAEILKAYLPQGDSKSVAAMHVIASDRAYGTAEAILTALKVNDHIAVQRAAERALIAISREDDVRRLHAGLAADQAEHVCTVCIRVLNTARPETSRDEFESLLASKNSRIRLEAAVALASQSEKAAIEPLVELLSANECDIRHRAGTTLAQWFKRDFGYRAYASLADRAKAIASWRKWIDSIANSSKQLPRFAKPHERGHVLVVRGTTLMELGPDGHVIHKQDGFNALSEAIAIETGNRLVTDFHGQTVYEYDQNWNEVRRSRMPFQPRGSHRLADGRTLVIGMHLFCLLDRNGNIEDDEKVAFGSNMTGSLLLPESRFLVTENDTGRIAELDTSGRVTWQMQVENAPRSVQILDDGRTLVADFRQAAIFTSDGKAVWRYPLEGVQSAEQLRSGNLLLAHNKGLTLIDLDGKVLWRMDEPEAKGAGFYAKTY